MELWLYYSIFALILTSITILSLNFLGKILNGTDEIRLFMMCSFIVAGLVSLILLMIDRKNTVSNANNIIKNKTSNITIASILIGFGILLVYNFNYQALAYNHSKKLAFPQLIINMNMVVVILVSLLFLNQTLNWQALIGILLTIIGLTIVIYFK